MEMSKTYDPSEFESRLYKEWEEKGYFKAETPFFARFEAKIRAKAVAHSARAACNRHKARHLRLHTHFRDICGQKPGLPRARDSRSFWRQKI